MVPQSPQTRLCESRLTITSSVLYADDSVQVRQIREISQSLCLRHSAETRRGGSPSGSQTAKSLPDNPDCYVVRTSCPASINPLACSPKGEPLATASLNMSPVEICDSQLQTTSQPGCPYPLQVREIKRILLSRSCSVLLQNPWCASSAAFNLLHRTVRHRPLHNPVPPKWSAIQLFLT